MQIQAADWHNIFNTVPHNTEIVTMQLNQFL